MVDAVGVTPERMEEIDKSSIVELSTTSSGVKSKSRGGVETILAGAFGTKEIATLTAFDKTPVEVPVPNWWLPFADSITIPAPTPDAQQRTTNSVDWTKDGLYLAIGGSGQFSSDRAIWVYKRLGDVLTRINVGATNTATDSCQHAAFSPDGQWLAATFNTDKGQTVSRATFVGMWQRTGDSFAWLGDQPVVDPISSVTPPIDMEFSPSGTYLASSNNVGSAGSGTVNRSRLTIWKRTGSVLSRIFVVPSPFDDHGYGVSWSPDEKYVAIAKGLSPFVTVYKREGDTFTEMPTPAALPPARGRSIEYSPDGKLLMVGHEGAPYLTLYSVDGDGLTKVTMTIDVNPGGTVTETQWSRDMKTLHVLGGSVPISAYKRTGSDFVRLTPPTAQPPGSSNDISLSPDEGLLAVGNSTSPYLTTYKAADVPYGGIPIRSI